MKYFVWALMVWVPVSVLAIAMNVGSDCPTYGCFGPSSEYVAIVLILVFGLPIYLIGLLVLWWWDRMGRWSK